MIAPAAGATWDALHTDAAGNLNATAALIFLLRTNVSCFDVDMFLSSDGVVFIGHPVKEAARLSVQPAEVGLRCMLWSGSLLDVSLLDVSLLDVSLLDVSLLGVSLLDVSLRGGSEMRTIK